MANIEVSLNEKVLEETLRKRLEEDRGLRPVEFGSDSEYAFDTEFGSDGIVGKQRNKRSQKSDEGRKVQELIKKEISKNYGLSGAELDKKAKEVYKNRVAFGQIPDPYVRPAIHRVINEISKDGTWLPSHGSLGLADRILDTMRRILEENKTLFSEDISRHMFSGYRDTTGKESRSMDLVSPEAMEQEDSKANGSRHNGHKGIQEGLLRCRCRLKRIGSGEYCSNTPTNGWTFRTSDTKPICPTDRRPRSSRPWAARI